MTDSRSAIVTCGTSAGIHSANCGGSTQRRSAASTMSTPALAQASWCVSCAWSSKACPRIISNRSSPMTPAGDPCCAPSAIPCSFPAARRRTLAATGLRYLLARYRVYVTI